MKNALRKFAQNLEDLRDFVDLLAPVLTGRQESQFKQDAQYLAPLALVIHELNLDFMPADEGLRTRLQNTYEDKIEITRDGQGSDQKLNFKVKGDLAKPFSEAMKRMAKGKEQIALLYRSALISLVSAAEWYLSQLLHTYFDRFPDAAGSGEKAFSLRDLKTLGSIEEAREYLIEMKVEEILRSSLDDWLKFFKTGPKLSMGYLDPYQEDLAEVFQRRDVVVHNGGVANRHYCARVSERHRKGVEIGTPLPVSQEYLDCAISLFERSFLLIGAELWKKLDPLDDERGNVLMDISFKHLCAERWHVAETLSYFTAHDSKLSERSKMVGKVNFWQCMKWQGRFDEVRSDVASEDVSAKEDIYRLAKHALLDEEDAFAALLERMLDEKKIPTADARSWPLFRVMCASARVQSIITGAERAELTRMPTDA